MNSYLTWQTGLTSALLVVGVVLSLHDRRRAAWLWAFLLPVDFVTGVPVEFFDVVRYAGAAVLVLWVPADLDDGSRNQTRHLAVVMAALALVRGATALLHHDGNGLRFATVLMAATATAYLIAQRRSIHGAIVSGFMSGLALSSVVALMQALHITTIREGNEQGSRFPGLSTYTMLLTWQLVFGLIIATYLVVTRHRTRGPLFWAGVVLLPTFALASVANGAQGGLLGIGAAGLAFLWCQRDRIGGATLRRIAVGLFAVGVVTAGVIQLSSIEIPTVTGFGEGNFRNEHARIDIIGDGLREFRAHPIAGMSRADFIEKHEIAAHFLPVDSAAVAGILGLLVSTYLLGWLLWRLFKGPADHRPQTVAGFVAMVVMVANTLTDSYGPFVGISRAMPLFIALVATNGSWLTTVPEGHPPAEGPGGGGPDDTYRQSVPSSLG